MEKLGLVGNLMVYRVVGFIFLVISLTYFFRPKAMIKLDNLGKNSSGAMTGLLDTE